MPQPSTPTQPRTPTSKRYLLIEEAAEIARAPVETVRHWIKTGRLRSVRPGRRRLVVDADLHEFIGRSATGGLRSGR